MTVLTVASPRRITGLRFFACTILCLPSLSPAWHLYALLLRSTHILAMPFRRVSLLVLAVPSLLLAVMSHASPPPVSANHRFSVALPDFSAALPEFALLLRLLTATPFPALPTPLLDFGAVMGIS